MKRREFFGLISGMAAWPFAARAQRPDLPVIGYLSPRSAESLGRRLVAFRQGLAESGCVEGRDAQIEFRWADGNYDNLMAMAADLASRKVAVIVAGLAGAPFAAKASTKTIPIVFVSGVDPVKSGLVASFNQPGGNVTGVSVVSIELGAKRLQVLQALVPNATTMGVLVNPDNPTTASFMDEIQAAARSLNLQLDVLNASAEQHFEPAFVSLSRRSVRPLLVAGDAFFTSQSERLAALTTRYAVPASFAVREFSDAGGLISYGPNFTDAFRQAGAYAGRLLKGTPVGELPVLQPTHFEMVINLKAAKALGLTVPPSLLATATDVIE